LRIEYNDIEASEEKAAESLNREIASHIELIRLTFNFINKTLQLLPKRKLSEISQAEKVCSSLLLRLTNDLRCIDMLVSRGYPLQAGTLASSVFEIAYTIIFIGSDEARAQRWIDHDDPKRAFCTVRNMVESSLNKRGKLMSLSNEDIKERVESEYRIYRQFCWPKHTNPLLQKVLGYRDQGGKLLMVNGPDTSEDAIRVAWFALDYTAGLLVFCISVFVEEFLAGDEIMEITQDALLALQERGNALKQAAISRWGQEDPFPGKW